MTETPLNPVQRAALRGALLASAAVLSAAKEAGQLPAPSCARALDVRGLLQLARDAGRPDLAGQLADAIEAVQLADALTVAGVGWSL